MAQMVKCLPTVWETWVQSLSREDPLEKEMATHSSILQYCLENPMDGGAWWATVHGVAKSRTQLNDFTFTFHFPLSVRPHSSPVMSSIPTVPQTISSEMLTPKILLLPGIFSLKEVPPEEYM